MLKNKKLIFFLTINILLENQNKNSEEQKSFFTNKISAITICCIGLGLLLYKLYAKPHANLYIQKYHKSVLEFNEDGSPKYELEKNKLIINEKIIYDITHENRYSPKNQSFHQQKTP
jgi:hypothetical protein